jgi:hypothetical protein
MTQAHVGMMKLRQLRAGELRDEEARAVREHADGCADCRGKLTGLQAEQARFEEAVSFDRFAAGVERAARPRRPSAARWVGPALALMAATVVTIAAPRLMLREASRPNRAKGGPEVSFFVGSAAGSREAPADAPALLSPGEGVMIRYSASAGRYLTVIAIDEQGVVTPVYPERGPSLRVEGQGELPDSLELTGPGAERLVAILSEEALEVGQVVDAARAAYGAAGGDLGRLLDLEVPGQQFHRTVQKP